MMRFQPASLSPIQRQTLLDSLSHLRLTNRYAQQRTARGTCCRQATRIANARIQQASSSAITSSRQQQQRYFAASRQFREESSLPDHPSILGKGKEREKEEADTEANKLINGRKHEEVGKTRNQARSNTEIHGHNAISSILKLDRLESLTGEEKVMDKSYTTDRIDNASVDSHPSSEKNEVEVGLFKRPRSRKSREWLKTMFKWMRDPLQIKTGVGETHPLEERVKRMGRCSIGLYRTWNEGKEYVSEIGPNIIVRMVQAMARLGIQCRQIRKDKKNHDLLLQQINVHLSEMIVYAEQLLEERGVVNLNFSYSLQCLRIQSLSLQEKQEEARGQLENLLESKEWQEELDEIEEAVLSATTLRRSHPRLISLADALGSVLQISLNRMSDLRANERVSVAEETMGWLSTQSELFHFNSLRFPMHMFRFNVLTCTLKDPLHYLESRKQRLDKDALDLLASSICRTLLRDGAILMTYKIYRWALGAKVTLDEWNVRQLLRLASLERESLIATRMVNSLLKKIRNGERVLELNTLRTMVWSCARRQEDKKMEELLRILAAQYDQKQENREEFAFEARMLCYSRIGDIERAVRLVEQRYDMHIAPDQVPERGLLYPDHQVHSRLVQTYIRADERDEAETMLHRMVQFGHRPDKALLNYVLEYYAKIDDLPSTLALFRQMKDSHLKVDVRTCTSLIALFARRKDSDSAFRVIETMKKDGLRPDRMTWNALLNAYVEVGDWQATIDLFTWMQHHRDHRLQPSSSTYNTVLKAHILRAIPVQDVFSFFKHIVDAGVDPDGHTMTLVLQSVADAGLMDLAEQVFSSIEDRLGDMEGKASGKGANMWHFTIMIQGYLRAGNIDIARDYANELRERGITATGVLWSVLMKAYAARDEDERLETSHSMIQSASFLKSHEYTGAYQPLIDLHSKRANVEQVESLLQELAEKEADIPINLWTALMDAFRRQGNLLGALEIWNLIFDKAVEVVNLTDYIDTNVAPEAVKSERARRSNLICLPLSILINILASRGEHERIAQEWLRCRKAGFAFDSHNWNHLCTAFIRAGRIVDSLNILTRVLPNEPPSKMWSELELASEQKRTPVFQLDPLVMIDSPSRPPNRRHQHRGRDDLDAYYPLEEEDVRMREWQQNLASSSSTDFYPSEEEVQANFIKSRSSRSQEPSILRYLEAQAKRDEIFSPFYAHFETMRALDEAIGEIERSGGAIKVKDKTVSLQETLEGYPAVTPLLARYREKVSLLQDLARRNAAREKLH